MISANDNTRKRELLAHIRTFSIGFLLTIGGGALAATFNLFQPATGVLVGNASTYVTSAAANSDIISLWSGTCSNATYLRGDGSCQTPPGTTTGANPSATVGLSAVNGSANTFMRSDAAPALSLGGTSAQYLRGDTTLATFPTIPSGANPSASVGLTAINGSSSNFMRSDAAPALSQAITPTWTGLHKFTATYSGAGTGALEINAAMPLVRQVESAAATDSRYWRNYVNSGRMTFDISNDAENVNRNWLDIGRSGNAVTDIVFGNTTDNPSYTFSGSGPVLLGTGYVRVGSFGSVTLNTIAGRLWTGGTSPAAILINTAAGADSKRWDTFISSSGTLGIRTVDDSDSTTKSLLTAARSGTSISSVTFGNSTDNPTFTFAGTGSTTFGGSVSANGSIISKQASARITVSGGACSVSGTPVSKNVSSCTYSATGVFIVNLAASLNNGWICNANAESTLGLFTNTQYNTATSNVVRVFTSAAVATDPTAFNVTCQGNP